MTFEEICNIMSLPITDELVQQFLVENNLKQPKKLTISNRSSDTGYWIESKKLNYSLYFSIEIHNPKFKPLQGERKGTFIPRLTNFRLTDNKANFNLPFDIAFSDDLATLIQKMGEPTYKSSDISPSWLNDDGTESFCGWELPVANFDNIYLLIEYSYDHSTLSHLSLILKQYSPIIDLYYENLYENHATFEKNKANHITRDLFFIRWALENDFFNEELFDKTLVQDFLDKKISIYEVLKALQRGYIAKQDFKESMVNFVQQYCKNLGGRDIYLYNDFINIFLQDKKLRENSFGDEAQAVLDQVEFNDENYKSIKKFLDKRLAEYNEHQFHKSKQLK